jgi:hypothetical protein
MRGERSECERVNICRDESRNRKAEKMKILMLIFQRDSEEQKVRPVTEPLAKVGKMEKSQTAGS